MTKFSLDVVSLSDKGLKRDNNEDAVGSHSEKGIAILADGMGGYKAGEVASAIAVSTVLERLEKAVNEGLLESTDVIEQIVRTSVQQANGAIFNAAQNDSKYKNMGTTLVVLLLNDGVIHYAHVGDSRLYRLRDGKLEQVTKDHSLINELIEKGFYTEEEAENADNKNVITRAMGVKADVEPDVSSTPAVDGDIYMMCSDGLTDLVDDNTIASLLNEHRDTPHTACKTLVEHANNNGGKDNVSVIVATLSQDQAKPASKLSSIVKWLFKH